MKVVQLVNGPDTGGAMTHILSLLNGFGTSIEIVMVSLNEGPITKAAREMGLEVYSLNGNLLNQYVYFSLLMKKIKDVDLIHTHGSRANLVGGLFGRVHHRPVATSVHSDYQLDYDETLLRRMVFKPLSALALRLTTYQITISQGIKQLLVQRGFKADKLYHIYNGLDFSTYVPTLSKQDFLDSFNIPQAENLRYVGILSRYHPVKGLDVFIDGAARVCKEREDAVFLIAGGGDQKLKRHYQQMIEASGFSNRILMLGFIKPVSNMLQILHINTLTSHSETFPYALLEGGYFGIPAISSKVGGVSELITHDETGLLFADGDGEGFKQSVVSLLQDAEKRNQLGQALQNRIITEHSHIKMAQAYKEIYTHIIGRWKR